MRLLSAIFLLIAAIAAPAHAERIKDLGNFQGIRSNQLTGYGIVVGLTGTGDDNLEYTVQSMKGVAARFGLSLPPGVNPGLKNAAAVLVTAELPAFSKPGQRIDVTVAAIGKAKSLRGGSLIMMPLYGADGQVYAMAQGSLAVGGLGAEGDSGSKVIINVPSSGRIPDGATVERAVDTGFADSQYLTFNLAKADFTTAERVQNVINSRLGRIARTVDGVSIVIDAPAGAAMRSALVSQIQDLPVESAEPAARVIVNARTGTIVINSAVRVGPAAVSHGKLTVRIDEQPRVSQPGPFSRGETKVVPDSQVSVEETKSPMFVLAPGPQLSEIVKAVNQVGASPADLVAILEALKEAGALKAELVVL
ncbi:flagellar basal body P-ring protein FlgI [Sphingomonas sp. ID0503]|uniref:flagellar basal body P-ring protein FlgI n=1 Tax=Sphingomonas sp. ID0503 TaxID=3399691 RepID=UPI003AFAC6DB